MNINIELQRQSILFDADNQYLHKQQIEGAFVNPSRLNLH